MIYGKKEFLLYPPEDSWDLYLYPYLHPRATKSQVPFFSEELHQQQLKYSRNKVKPITAVIERGDVLYIPPLWFHSVRSIESSISLSMWSPCVETQIFNEILDIGFPIPEELKSIEKIRNLSTGKLFVEILLKNLLTEEFFPHTAKEFIRLVEKTRYAPLYPVVPSLQPNPSFQCPPPVTDKRIIYFYEREVKSKFAKFLKEIPRPRLDIWLADYCEIILHLFLAPEDISSMLLCF